MDEPFKPLKDNSINCAEIAVPWPERIQSSTNIIFKSWQVQVSVGSTVLKTLWKVMIDSYSGTRLIRTPRGQAKVTVLTDVRI